MKKCRFLIVSKFILLVTILFFSNALFAQGQTFASKTQSNFWKNVQFGGEIGLGFGSGYTDISISPSTIYNINQTVSVGTALRFGFVSSKKILPQPCMEEV